MTHTIKNDGTQVIFPPESAVCSRPSQATYRVEHTFSFGRGTVPISLAVPLCTDHLALAKAKSPAERACERIGLFGGGLVGLVIAGGLMAYWLSTNQGSLVQNLLVAALTGLGFFLIVSVATHYWLAPTFASSETKAARSSVVLKKYWPANNELELELSNEHMANELTRLNA